MKKIVASVGLVALGASALQAASPLTMDSSRFWSVSATLRGFYDDNVNGIPSDAALAPGQKRDSFGYEVSPGVTMTWPLEQTTIGLSYLYSMKYYEQKPIGNTDHVDQVHNFSASLDHQFNERYQLSVRESFVIGQEPDVLRSGSAFTTFQRIPGDNIRNFASIVFDAQLTPTMGLEAGYANSFFDYADNTQVNAPNSPLPGQTTVIPSNAGLLNRLEHLIHLDGRWQIEPQTVGILGYQYSESDYTADQVISGTVGATGAPISPIIMSDARNNRSHYGYVGADHTFRPELSGSVRVGARWNDYYNDLANNSEISPYAMLNLRYTYMAGSYVEAGFSYDRNATDLFSVSGSSITTDAESASLWLSVHHKITQKITGTLMTQVQNSVYNGGAYNNQDDLFFLLGLNVEYHFNPNFSASVGYNYDILSSDLANRGYDRNRVYVGVTAKY